MALLLQELGWPDVADYLQHDDRLILVTGSCEQHGRHLTFATDVWQPWEIALRLSERTGVLVAPPVHYGMSLHHLGFPGSLSLRPHTLILLIEDLLTSAYTHGFRHILLLNGHGGNTASISSALTEVLHERPDLIVRTSEWWHEPAVQAVVEEAFGRKLGHADAGETSVVLAVRPDVVRLDRAQVDPPSSFPFLTRWVFQEQFPHGVIGSDPRQASAEVGERILSAAVAAYEEVLRGWA